jgi:hypothetical protein
MFRHDEWHFTACSRHRQLSAPSITGSATGTNSKSLRLIEEHDNTLSKEAKFSEPLLRVGFKIEMRDLAVFRETANKTHFVKKGLIFRGNQN